MLIKSEFKYYILLFKLCFVIAFIVFGTIGGCGGGDNKTIDPDIPPPVVGDNDDDIVPPVVGDDDDDIVPPVVGMGAIRGSVTSPSGIPLNAVHVRAVNTSNNNQLSAFSGINNTGNPRLINTKDNNRLTFQSGIFLIENVPPGNYRVLIEKMDSRNIGFDPSIYTFFVIDNNPTISFPDEYYNGADESSFDNPLDFDVVTVNAGQTTQNINIIANAPDSTCPSGQKECTGLGCIPNSETCCGDGTSCPDDFPNCTNQPFLCCPAPFTLLCPDGIFCVNDLSDCP